VIVKEFLSVTQFNCISWRRR